MGEELERLREELARVKEHRDALVRLIDASPVAILTLDTQGNVRTWNPAATRIFGWEKEEVLGKRAPFVPEDRAAEHKAHHSTQVASGAPLQELEVRRARKDGRLIDVSVTTSLLRDASGQVVDLIGIIADITQRKEAERALHELNATLEQKVEERTLELREAMADLESFSYSVSHDLRSPLRALDGFARALQEDYEDKLDEDGLHYLSVIVRNAARMGTLIDDLLEFSRTSRQEIQRSEVDLKALVREIFEDLCEQNRQEAELVLAELPPARVDPSLFRQVLVNLLSNALKYSSKTDRPRVEVGFKEEPDRIVYHVVDNGVGFDLKFADKLFGVFQRLHRADEFEGTGVGLAIVARIIKRHGGDIWADAEPGRGATFFFALPLEPAASSNPA